jgi:hypothetical protein
MQGRVDKVEGKPTKNPKVTRYDITIAGTRGSSLDAKFEANLGKNVEYEVETTGEWINFKFVKALEGNVQASQNHPAAQAAPANTPKPVTAADIKLLFIPKALESAINGAKLTCKDGTITSKLIMEVADAYLTWMVAKAMEE